MESSCSGATASQLTVSFPEISIPKASRHWSPPWSTAAAVLELNRYQTTCVVEYTGGLAIIAQLTPDTLLSVLVKPAVNVGSLLYDLRRYRVAIAELL